MNNGTDMIYTVLGTQGSMPAPRSGLAAGHLQYEGTSILFDCGEGTQRQLRAAQVAHPQVETQVDVICLTHLHLDHYWGLRPLLETWNLTGRVKDLTILSPDRHGVACILQGLPSKMSYKIINLDVKDLKKFSVGKLEIFFHRTYHRVASTMFIVSEQQRAGNINVEKAKALGLNPGPAYKLLQEGMPVALPNGNIIKSEDVVGPAPIPRRMVYTGDHDVVRAKGLPEEVHGVDLLVHDTTFTQALVERARETMHSTGVEAWHAAREAGVHTLMLNHFSERVQPQWIVREVRVEMENQEAFTMVISLEDFQQVILPMKPANKWERVQVRLNVE